MSEQLQEQGQEPWYVHHLERRAPSGGMISINGKFYPGGEFLPFYIPREVMPQVEVADYPDLLKFAESRGVQYFQEEYDPRVLHPHQKVSKILVNKMGPEVLTKPALVSVDMFILDGNHRWAAHVHYGSPIPVYRFALPFEDSIRFLFEFPKTFSYGDGNFHPVRN